MLKVWLGTISIVFLGLNAYAWNDFGHMTVAAIAYQHLTPNVRVKVGALLKLNPNYQQWIVGVPSADQTRVAFIKGATWPDLIKRAPGYIWDGDDNGHRPSWPDAARNIGYADKLQHRYWHFIDRPFSPDGTPLMAPIVPNAQTTIALLRATLQSLTASDDVKSYDLVWLLHLVGDVHQPLHATSRFDQAQPDGNRGGNLVALCAKPCKDELHAFWTTPSAPALDRVTPSAKPGGCHQPIQPSRP